MCRKERGRQELPNGVVKERKEGRRTTIGPAFRGRGKLPCTRQDSIEAYHDHVHLVAPQTRRGLGEIRGTRPPSPWAQEDAGTPSAIYGGRVTTALLTIDLPTSREMDATRPIVDVAVDPARRLICEQDLGNERGTPGRFLATIGGMGAALVLL